VEENVLKSKSPNLFPTCTSSCSILGSTTGWLPRHWCSWPHVEWTVFPSGMANTCRL